MKITTDPSQWNILIVDDEPDSIGVIEYVLKYYGSHVRAASSGPTCLTMLRQEKPHLMFLDIQMPGMSGWDVLQQVRQDILLKDLTIIALTAHAMAGDRERILKAGFDGYFSKPISPMTFIADLKEILNQRSLV